MGACSLEPPRSASSKPIECLGGSGRYGYCTERTPPSSSRTSEVRVASTYLDDPRGAPNLAPKSLQLHAASSCPLPSQLRAVDSRNPVKMGCSVSARSALRGKLSRCCNADIKIQEDLLQPVNLVDPTLHVLRLSMMISETWSNQLELQDMRLSNVCTSLGLTRNANLIVSVVVGTSRLLKGQDQ
jgi:hypothetical protein